VYLYIGVLSLLVGLGGCDESSIEPHPGDVPRESHRSALERNTNPEASPAKIAELVRGNHDLAFDLYHELRGRGADESKNLLLSPFSIRTAFAMAYAGAKGETKNQMAEVLRYTLEQDHLHDTFNALTLELEKRNLPATPKEDPVELYPANSFWGQTGYPFLDSYLDLLALNYGCGVEALDFAHAPEGSRRVINLWVAERTRERIEDLLPQGSITPSTVAVLANALYFKAPWASPFEEDLTADGAFYLMDGREITVPLMQQEETFAYTEGEDYQALELPYRGDDLGMLILLPAEGEWDDLVTSFDADRLEEVTSGLERARVKVTLPRFTFESEFKLKEMLSRMGMPIPFTGGADFTGITDSRRIFIDEAYHKTFIGVDEKGTEAAAATAIVFVETAMPPASDRYEFKADRPFLVLIRDRVTGAILFVGHVLDPRD
jgi:serpin B